AERRDIAVMTPQQAAVQPDVGDQERAVETDQGSLAVPRAWKPNPVPDGLIAAGRAVQARHRDRCPGVVIELEPGEAAVLALAQGGNRHPPARVQLLSIQRLDGEERTAIVQRHLSALSSGSLRHEAVARPDAIPPWRPV